MGNIGEQYLKLARSLFGRVIACSRSEKNLSQLDQFYSLSQRTDFFSQCDYLIICLPLTEETMPLLKDESFYNQLRENVVIINLARGELFDENQLCSFLKSHNKSCYLTDVTYPEPYPEDGVLSQLDQVFITPHIGGRREDIWNLLIVKNN
ncbi:NAD(P)-dependent oxidoreductase [Bacteriovorax sp. DB6_IX]|uniref:NAD(P)-dependent oxidoreductase n=1 Tax=Bacteriovorax sp. DB6_IX TaxID=1353530 RepID=UPI00055665E5|nr:NAD(P)-dependent oxidoreductase [Bacteriovorax sp. DB6_IX]